MKPENPHLSLAERRHGNLSTTDYYAGSKRVVDNSHGANDHAQIDGEAQTRSSRGRARATDLRVIEAMDRARIRAMCRADPARSARDRRAVEPLS